MQKLAKRTLHKEKTSYGSLSLFPSTFIHILYNFNIMTSFFTLFATKLYAVITCAPRTSPRVDPVHLFLQLFLSAFLDHPVDVLFISFTNQKAFINEYQPSRVSQNQEVNGTEEDQQENCKLSI